MGQFGKIKSIDELPADAELDRLIREAAELAKSAPAPRKTKHAPEAGARAASRIRRRAGQGAEGQSRRSTASRRRPQRDYFEWIAEAKQDATRQKRIATAIEWLSEGKRRHWKYQNC